MALDKKKIEKIVKDDLEFLIRREEIGEEEVFYYICILNEATSFIINEAVEDFILESGDGNDLLH
jgi:hypothetical protein